MGGYDGQGVNDCQVYNNLFYSASYPAVTREGSSSNFNVRNNIFVGPASSSLVATGSGFTYQGNCYWSTNGGFNVGGYSSLEAWANQLPPHYASLLPRGRGCRGQGLPA
jgi:hypothetical protein